jgi:hypothetical protein
MASKGKKRPQGPKATGKGKAKAKGSQSPKR